MRVHERTGRPMPWYQDVDGFRIPGAFSAEAYRSGINYKPRKDDLFVVTYPKCGTTWVKNIIACIFRNGKPLVEVSDYFTGSAFLEMSGAETAENMKRPGCIKAHLPFYLTPYSPEAKYIFVTRNPKDCVVSFYYHTQNPGYDFKDGSFDDYFELFINGETDFGDYFDTLMSWYEHRNDPNVLFLIFEDLKKDIESNIMKIAEFIDIKYKQMLENDPTLMSNVIEYSSVKYMRESTNNLMKKLLRMTDEEAAEIGLPEEYRKILQSPEVREADNLAHEFVRKGTVGDWRNHLSADQNARLEAKFKERTKGTDIADWWKDCM